MSPDKLGIVVGVDGSPASTVAIEWAARDAGMRNVALRLVHVVPSATGEEFRPETFAQSEIARWRRDSRRRIIEDAHKVAVDASPTRHASQVTSEVLYGPVVPALVALSEKADMVVVGCQGQSALARVLLGSVSSGLVHHAHCPVAVVHDEDRLAACPSQAPVVLGVDGSPTSELATALAFDEASRRGVTLVALHAWSENGRLGFGHPGGAPIEWADREVREEEVLAERLSGWQERYPDVVVHTVVVCDRPALRLLEQADAAQLLVVGSHGRGAISGTLLGSVSRAVVKSAQIPVIVARLP